MYSCPTAVLPCPQMIFARLVAFLGKALVGNLGDSPQVNWDHGGIAMLDIQGSRILLGYSAGLDGKFAACLSVGVGCGPGNGTTTLAERHDTVSQMILNVFNAKLSRVARSGTIRRRT